MLILTFFFRLSLGWTAVLARGAADAVFPSSPPPLAFRPSSPPPVGGWGGGAARAHLSGGGFRVPSSGLGGGSGVCGSCAGLPNASADFRLRSSGI